MKNRKISQLRNLGPRMEYYLGEVGIKTEKDLRRIGPVNAYLMIKPLAPRVLNRMALYAIYGALTDQNCIHLPEETKEWLEEELRKDK